MCAERCVYLLITMVILGCGLNNCNNNVGVPTTNYPTPFQQNCTVVDLTYVTEITGVGYVELTQLA